MVGKTIILAVCRNLAQQSWSYIEIEPRFGPHWISQRLYIVHLWSNSCLVQTEDSCIWVSPDSRDLGKHVVHTTVCCPRVNSFTVKKNTQIIKNAKKNRKGCCSKMCSHVFVHWQMCHEACEICTHWPPIWSPQGTQLKTSNTLNKIDYQVNFFLNVSKSFWCHVISYHSQSTPLVLLFQ